jgi:hypothetical protein
VISLSKLKALWLPAALACVLSAQASAAVINNGGFESGFTGWTRVDQIGSDGTFLLQTGTTSPVNAVTVPAPPGGVTAAMTDAQGPGSHVLLQSFTLAAPVGSAALVFDLFVGNRANAFFAPNTLDFSTPTLNQQARVDILRAGADPFSVLVADVLQNAFRTNVGDPLVSGYTHYMIDITSVLNANVNNMLTLRFAEADNVSLFQFGVDNVDIQVSAAAVPEPSSCLATLGALLGIAWMRRRRR